MKQLLLLTSLFLFQITYSQSLENDGISLEEVKYYYLESALDLSGDGTQYYSEVKLFDCDKSLYNGELVFLKLDIQSQYKDHLGGKAKGLPNIYLFKSLRDAKIHHRKEANNGKSIIEYTFEYYCKE